MKLLWYFTGKPVYIEWDDKDVERYTQYYENMKEKLDKYEREENILNK